MKISGFTCLRNGIDLGYPFRESLRSLVPICDEIVVALGDSHDGTADALRDIAPDKLRIIPTVWDPQERTHGTVLSTQTNIALRHCDGDWCLYLQADEVLHEQEYDNIRRAMRDNLSDDRVDGLLFDYRHFYGSYGYLGTARRWYHREVRAVRNGRNVQSWRDAQGFRRHGKKPRVRPADARVFHYGWVRPPSVMMHKVREFSRLWHSDDDVHHQFGDTGEFDYSQVDSVTPFNETHPAVMAEKIRAMDWSFTPPDQPALPKKSLRHRLLDFIEIRTGRRLMEYRNYDLLD